MAQGLAQWLGDFARELQAEPDKDRIMQAVVRAAVAQVPGAQCAGITLVSDDGEVTTPAETDDLMSRIDELQYQFGQGPCLRSARQHLNVRVDDLRTERRWPQFAAAATAAGAGSMLCLHLFVKGDSLGALNLMSREPGAFDTHSEDVGLLLASQAAIAMTGADLAASERELEDALARERQVVQRLHIMDGLKYTVLQTLAHDLRSPIAAVLTLTGVLRLGLAPGTLQQLPVDRQVTLLSDIERSVRTMEQLLTDLISTDPLLPLDARRASCDIADLVTRVLADHTIGRSHPIHTRLEPVTVQVDAAQVERIVDNLLNNAAKHLAADVPIWVETAAVGPGVLITVDDAGPGVPASLWEDIFEPFRRGTDATQPGLGLGLSLVSRYAQIHDGRAWVQDRPGGGASFRVYLPDTAAVHTPAPATPPTATAIRVLVCDDDPILGGAVATLISVAPGLELVGPPVQTGQQAIDAVLRFHPDVVVMDVDLIGPMDGFQATTGIKDISRTTNVVIRSGTTHQDQARHRAREAGASAFLNKTGPPTDLIDAIYAAANPDRAHPDSSADPARRVQTIAGPQAA